PTSLARAATGETGDGPARTVSPTRTTAGSGAAAQARPPIRPAPAGTPRTGGSPGLPAAAVGAGTAPTAPPALRGSAQLAAAWAVAPRVVAAVAPRSCRCSTAARAGAAAPAWGRRGRPSPRLTRWRAAWISTTTVPTAVRP